MYAFALLPRTSAARVISASLFFTFVLSGCGAPSFSTIDSAASRKSSVTLQWSTPAPIVYGTTLASTQLDTSASVPGQFTYSPAIGTTPSVGTQRLTAQFTPSDTAHYSSASISVELTVNKATPIITWPTPTPIVYGTTLSATQLDATASVAGQFTYSPAIGATPNVGTPSLTAKFTPSDAAHYSSASVTVALTVNKATPIITWPTPTAIPAGTALSTAQLNATASVAGSFTYTPAIGTTPATGTATLSALFTPSNTSQYNAVTTSVSLTVNAAAETQTVTNINVGSNIIQTGMKHLGMNIDGQSYYDSGQMMKNLVYRNPGFEGETWQSIIHCAQVTATTCIDNNPWAQWPANFLQGGTFEFIYGAANGETGTILSSTAADPNTNTSMTLQLSSLAKAPAAGDFIVVRKNMPGNAQAGWWTNLSSGSTISTEYSDLSPNTIGKQALRVDASAAGQYASVDSYFDSTNTHNFVLLNGTYQLTFRAKGLGGTNQLNVTVGRQISNGTYFNQNITLAPTWQDYTYTFTAAETPSTAPGTVDLHFGFDGATVLLDDVSLSAVTHSSNATVFRDEVVQTLASIHPGTLRYMDGLPMFGSSVDNMLAPSFARLRAGSSTQTAEQDDIPIGLHEFLQLCQAVGAEPWFTLPPAITPTEIQNLIQYFAGDLSTPYGAMRGTLGEPAPWTTIFPVIHLELGNEQWNSGTFPGNSIDDPIAYGNRVATVFGAARSAPTYDATHFDLIMGTILVNSWYTGQEIANSSNYDSVAVAPYLYGQFSDTSSNEAIFGPMFAEPEMWDSTPNGYMAQQSQTVVAAGKKLVSYEENLSTQSGSASQDMVNTVVPSVSGGVAMATHMLLQMRDLGVKTQNVWALPGYVNQFNNTNGGNETSPVYGTVIDMGGQSNRQRPVFLAEQLLNTAILPSMLGTSITGSNPTWDQLLSTNDNVQLNGAHELQTFAFTDGGGNFSVVAINLSRATALPVVFSGANEPNGTVTVGQLTSANLTDGNETNDTVATTTRTIDAFDPTATFSLPPFSVTVFTWRIFQPFGGGADQ